jgi:hypothetical protein
VDRFAFTIGVMVGASAGLLSVADGMLIPLAIIAGGGAAGATIALVLTIVRHATGDGG